MDGILAVELIRGKFMESGRQVRIPLQNGRSFKATLTDDGIMVDNLGSQPLLEWADFREAIDLLDPRCIYCTLMFSNKEE